LTLLRLLLKCLFHAESFRAIDVYTYVEKSLNHHSTAKIFICASLWPFCCGTLLQTGGQTLIDSSQNYQASMHTPTPSLYLPAQAVVRQAVGALLPLEPLVPGAGRQEEQEGQVGRALTWVSSSSQAFP
jgi:hypothetical protein